jgi:hypothetical protein
MSYQLMAWASEQTTGSGTRKAVLLALANHTSQHTGQCNPSIALIAEETEFSYRTVERALSDLCDLGFLERTRHRRMDGSLGVYEYTFPDTASPQPAAVAARATCQSGRAEPGTTKPEPMATTTDVVVAPGRAASVAPALVKIEGRNLPLDAICEVTGIQYGSPRLGGAVAALNGTHNKPGIRQLAWEEIIGAGLPVRFAAPEHLETAICDLIRERAAQYERRFSDDVELTPTALLKWWVDLPHMARRGDPDTLDTYEIAADELRRT